MDHLFGFVLAGFALAGSPGPATLSLAATGAAFGGRRGLAYMAGIIIGMIVVMIVTATGVIGVLLALPGVTPVLTGAAAVYFAYLAYRIATAPPLTGAADNRRQPSFAAGFLLSLVNPKGYVAMMALFSGFVLVRDRIALDAACKLLVLMAIILVVNIAWLFVGAALTPLFRAPRASRIINLIFAALLLLSVVVAMLA